MTRDRATIIVTKAILEHEGKEFWEYHIADKLSDIGSDSLDVVQICIIIERELDLELDTKDLSKIREVRVCDLIDMVEKYECK